MAAHPHGGLDWRMPGYYEASLARWADFVDIDPAVNEPTAAAEHLQAIEQILAEVLSTLASPPQGWRRLVYSRWMVAAILNQHCGNITKARKRAGPDLNYFCDLVERCRKFEDLPTETKDEFDWAVALTFFGKDKRNVSVVHWKPALIDVDSFVKRHGIDTYHTCLDYYTFWVWDCRHRELLANGRAAMLLNLVDSGDYSWGAIRRSWLGLAHMAKWSKAFRTVLVLYIMLSEPAPHGRAHHAHPLPFEMCVGSIVSGQQDTDTRFKRLLVLRDGDGIVSAIEPHKAIGIAMKRFHLLRVLLLCFHPARAWRAGKRRADFESASPAASSRS